MPYDDISFNFLEFEVYLSKQSTQNISGNHISIKDTLASMVTYNDPIQMLVISSNWQFKAALKAAQVKIHELNPIFYIIFSEQFHDPLWSPYRGIH